MTPKEELIANVEADKKARAVDCKTKIDEILKETNCILAVSRKETSVGGEVSVEFQTFIVANE